MLLWYLVLGLVVNTAWTEDAATTTTSSINDNDDSYYPSEEWSDVFDWKLLKVLSNEAVNVLVSPISLKIVLSMLYEGASGATQREFESGLQFITKANMRNKVRNILDSLHVEPASENKLVISTRLFLDSEIKPKTKYAKNVKNSYEADIIGTNFTDNEKTSSLINEWAEKSTQGAVPKLTSPDDLEDMIMLIANAVYFKGIWRNQFLKNNTCLGSFYVKPEMTRYIPFMTTTGIFHYLESEDLDAKILRMPYKHSEFSMFVVLPRSKGGLPELIQKINLYDLHRQLYDMNKKIVQVSMPRFQFRFKSSYTKILQQFGLHKMFQNTATFSGIAEGSNELLRQLVVSDIIQSTGIDVDEEGSKAYAATDVLIGNKIGVPDNVFNVSHPFLFFVQEETNGTIIFIGKVENPTHEEEEIKKPKDDIEKEFTTTEQNIDSQSKGRQL